MTQRCYHYWDAGPEVRVDFRPGDIVFMAGRDAHPPFEHVALVTEPASVRSDADFGEIVIIGLPESDPCHPAFSAHSSVGRCGGLRTHATRDSHWWQNHHQTGHPNRVWNLAGRVLSEADAVFFMDRLRHSAARTDILYAATFAVRPRAEAHPLRTNCVGFVNWAYRCQGVQLLKSVYPPYRGQYLAEYRLESLCNYPRPGHLARALSHEVTLPYRCLTQADAEKYCTAYQTLTDLRATGSSPTA